MTAEQKASMYMLERKENKTCSDYRLLVEWKDLQIKELQEEVNACKFAMAMSEKVEKQLREQIEKMKKCAICVDRHIWCVDCRNKSKFRLDVEIKDEN